MVTKEREKDVGIAENADLRVGIVGWTAGEREVVGANQDLMKKIVRVKVNGNKRVFNLIRQSEGVIFVNFEK